MAQIHVRYQASGGKRINITGELPATRVVIPKHWPNNAVFCRYLVSGGQLSVPDSPDHSARQPHPYAANSCQQLGKLETLVNRTANTKTTFANNMCVDFCGA